MEKSFSQCLTNVREDLTQIKQIRNYLDSNTDSQNQKDYSLNWQTIEAYNKILGTCSLGTPPDIDFLNTLLDSFQFISNNKEENVTWSNFGFELGVLCLKILSAIEHSEMFQYFFTKLLTVMNSFSQHTSDVWKAASRPILNVIINKKFSIDYLETVLTLYISILKNIDYTLLQDFAQHNLSILKTISKLIEKSGDFEIQKNIFKLLYLHVHGDKVLIENLFKEFIPDVKGLFHKFQTMKFEDVCRNYLNNLNKNLMSKREVFSISCTRLYAGGYLLEPLTENQFFWVDANNKSQRLTFQCKSTLPNSSESCTIHIKFSDITGIKIEHEFEKEFKILLKGEGLQKIFKQVKKDEIICLKGINRIIPQALTLLNKIESEINTEKPCPPHKVNENKENKMIGNGSMNIGIHEKNDTIVIAKEKSPKHNSCMNIERNNNHEKIKIFPDIVPESEELTSNSFVETLNANIELKNTKESESINKYKSSHKLFRDCENSFFDIVNNDFPEREKNKNGNNLNTRKTKELIKSKDKLKSNFYDDEKKQFGISSSQSDNYFRGGSVEKKMKPTLPKLVKGKNYKNDENFPKSSLLDPNGYAFRQWIKPATSERKPMDNVKNLLLQTNFSKEKQQESLKEKSEVPNATTTAKTFVEVSSNKGENMSTEEMKNLQKNFEKNFSTSEQNIFDLSETVENKNSQWKISGNESDLNFSDLYPSSDISEKEFEWDFNEKIEWEKMEFSGSLLNSHEFHNHEDDLKKFDTDLNFESWEDFFLNVIENNNNNNSSEEMDKNQNFPMENMSKKMKTNESSFFVMKTQIDKIEEKTKKETNEIVRLFNATAKRFVNKLREEYYNDVISFIRNTTDATFALGRLDFDDLNDSIKKFYVYFREKCSVSNYLDTIHSQISIIEKAEEIFFNSNEKSLWKGIESVNKDLESMINKEIEQLIGDEADGQDGGVKKNMN
ncbi:DNA double-strand break repair Rad50 ATPase, putative [Pediculus humanus corporis]|uniref:DNA double-strand break repair Rad50 ATPase, putative n=1 Tax=Pediculus humanus subsp. corporis TaxID=121224 RepID=E0VN80_PEDHC|nr:DNA double-strand break repair Rad50 ATPase, putative [Pediculus humanus corporis]EEB14836.1 DNA double-strand break repair Rad50 ATPase, putative [Pediculus humanus corporis]